MPTFNKQHLADLVKQEAEIKTQLQDCTASLNDTYATDGWDEAKHAKYQADQLRHGQLTREYKTAKEEREAYALFEPERAQASRTSAFARFLIDGADGLEADEIKQYTETDLQQSGHGKPFVFKGSTKSDDSSGVEVTDINTSRNVIDTLKAYGGASRMAYQFTTANGNQLRLPAQDDSMEEGVVVGQGAQTSLGNLDDFKSSNFGASTMHSKRIRITREMVQDGIIDIEAFAQKRAVRRLGRGWDRRFSEIGGGTLAANAPAANTLPGDGEVSIERAASDSSFTSAAAGKVSYEDLVNLIYDIEPAYLEGETGEEGLGQEMGGRTGFLLSHSAEKAIRLLKDDDGRPLWQPSTASISTMGGGMILGYPYEKSFVLDAKLVTKTKKDVFFGNFSYFGIRTVNTFEVFRFWDSRTAENNEIEIIAFSRRFARHMVNGPLPGAGKVWPGLPMIKKLKIA